MATITELDRDDADDLRHEFPRKKKPDTCSDGMCGGCQRCWWYENEPENEEDKSDD